MANACKNSGGHISKSSASEPNDKVFEKQSLTKSSVLNVLNVLASTGNIHVIALNLLFNLSFASYTASHKWNQLRFGTVKKKRFNKGMTNKPLLRQSLAMLDICGLKPTNQNAWSLLRAAFAFFLCLVLCVELLLEIVFNWRGLLSMEGVGLSAALYQVAFKQLMMVINSDQLAKLLQNMDEFPPLEAHEDQIRLEMECMYTKAMKYARIIISSYAAGMAAYVLVPYFAVGNSLPFDTYHPTDRSKPLQYKSAYFLQILFVCYGSFALAGFDYLFLSSIFHLLCELEIIKQKIANIKIHEDIEGDEIACLKEVYQIVDHHNKVLMCIKRLEKIYSMLLLYQFLSSLVCICAGLLSIIANGFPPDGLTFLKYTGYLCLGLMQLFSYCLAGAYLIVETQSIALAAYESDWWVKTQPKFRMSLMLVIQRANRAGKLTAGGMYILNLESFTGVVKNALSFFTLVQAMYTRMD